MVWKWRCSVPKCAFANWICSGRMSTPSCRLKRVWSASDSRLPAKHPTSSSDSPGPGGKASSTRWNLSRCQARRIGFPRSITWW